MVFTRKTAPNNYESVQVAQIAVFLVNLHTFINTLGSFFTFVIIWGSFLCEYHSSIVNSPLVGTLLVIPRRTIFMMKEILHRRPPCRRIAEQGEKFNFDV